ncbi:MAG: PilZ domain-containing protein [Deltaproteobacteria bacterium]|nr:PilZ domain-containing protein [Deltaproteobacteria bacterium]
MTVSPSSVATYQIYLALPRSVESRTVESLLETLRKELAGAIDPPVTLHPHAEAKAVLLGIRLRVPQSTRTLPLLLRAAAKARIGVVEPTSLSTDERRRFFDRVAAGTGAQFQRLPSLADVERVLGGSIRTPALAIRAAAHELHGIDIRFHLGDAWQVGRLRGMSLEVVDVITHVCPRPGDELDLVATIGPKQVPVRVSVLRASDDIGDGTGGFAAAILNGKDRAPEIVKAMARMGMTPPSPRRYVRYPVRWPVSLWLGGQWVSAAALDVSRRGLFISAATAFPIGTQVEMGLWVDDSGAAIRSGARVARVITPETAQSRGLAPGFGAELTVIQPSEDVRFQKFVERVSKRVKSRIVVGSGHKRLGPIITELVGVGYLASGATDMSSLLAKTSSCPPDLVVLDRELYQRDAHGASLVLEALRTRNVRTMHFVDDSLTTLRTSVDAALLA